MQHSVLLMIYYVKSGATQEFKHTLVLDNGFANMKKKPLTFYFSSGGSRKFYIGGGKGGARDLGRVSNL